MFGGSAWTYCGQNGQYYLHLFSEGQPDLNMDNPRVRDEVKDVMRYWLDMGVDGFREDVITLISKAEGLPNDHAPLSLPKGKQYYDCGPHLADYLGEFRHDVLVQHDCFVVGEAPFVDVEKARMLTGGPRESRLLDMVFSFEHMEADCLFTEYIPLPFSPRRFMGALSRWQEGLHGVGWNALYLENHDHPRVISRYGSERYRRESGSMLACAYLFLEGTPFIYQGQEIGMTNISLPSIEDYPDCIAQANYRSYVEKMGEEKALARVRRATRDNARTPMQWDATENAGFSTHKPWFAVNPNYRQVNVAVQGNDENSLLNFYRRAIKLRTQSAAVRWGEYHEFLRASGSVYAYSREFAGNDEHEAETLLVICCFGEGGHRVGIPGKFREHKREVLLANYPVEDANADSFVARPYEARVYKVL
jgi:oligo-1,6-glucosidase